MKNLVVYFCLLMSGAAAYAQQPDTFYISARNPNPMFSDSVLKLGTKYVVQATGGVSYWRDTVPPGEADADAGYLFHIPYMPGVPKDTIDSVNVSITWNAGFLYLPCNGSTCTSVPQEWDCGDNLNYHALGVHDLKEFHFDKDYLSMNGSEFCPRNGADMSRHSYVQGIMGNDQRAVFQFLDGDGDFVHNWGTIQIIITRLEPILHVSKSNIDFGNVRPFTTPPSQTVSIWNFGSPYFPGCNNATSGLSFTVDSITGDMATPANKNDGFTVTGLTVGARVDVGQGNKQLFVASFTPKRMYGYRGIIWLTTNDPQYPKYKIYLNAVGVQGLTIIADTLDFGDVPLNKPTDSTIPIKNIGNDILHLQGVSWGIQDAAFTLPNVPATSMPQGMTINPLFKFSPTKLKTYLASAIISSDGFGESQHTLFLKGRGVAAILEVDSVIDFGNVPVGDSVIDSLPLKNVGNIDFGVQFVQFSAGDSLDFSAEPRVRVAIMPDSILNWKMGFHPQKPGRRAAVAEIAADGGGAPHYVYVIGNGTVISKMTCTPRLDYGVVSIETTTVMSAVLHNVGNVPITLQQVSLAHGTNFSLPQTVFPTMRPHDSLYIDVVFSPIAQTAYTDTLTLLDDSLRLYIVTLTGNGRRFVGDLAVADTMDFGEVFVGDTAGKFLPLHNIGNARLVLTKVASTTPVTEFSAVPTLPIRMAADAMDSMQAFFHPTTVGVQSSVFEISDSLAPRIDVIQHVHDVVFIGTAIPPIVAVLGIDSNYTAPVGSTITIPVELRVDITKTNSTTFDGVLKFDGSLLFPLSVSAGLLTPGYTINYTETAPGVLSFSGSAGAGSPKLLGTGAIVNVTFEVLASVNKVTLLDVQTPKVGNGRNPRSVQTIPGMFTAGVQCGSDLTTTAATQIAGNVPNPFSASTSVRYVVGLPMHVTIEVYDAVGRKVADLVDADKAVGTYETSFETIGLPNGLYYCRMYAGQFVKTKSMMLMR